MSEAWLESALVRTTEPLTVSMVDLGELPVAVRDAVVAAIEECCLAHAVPYELVVDATFRSGRVDEVTLQFG